MKSNEIKTEYFDALRNIYGESTATYVLSRTDEIISHNDLVFGIERPTMQKHFCFSYGDPWSEFDSWGDAYAAVRNAQTNEEYFVAENLKQVSRYLEHLRSALANVDSAIPNFGIRVFRTDRDPRYGDIDFVRHESDVCRDTALIEKLISAYEAVQNRFEKRLRSYLKRYGLKHIRSWTYMSD